ncbi:hypothetical protein HN51_066104, partial [Arachis hypogaea]
GTDENAVRACSELIFAPIDEMFSDDAPLLPSSFCIILLDSKPRKKYCANNKGATETDAHGDKKDSVTASQTQDLTSGFEVGPTTKGARNAVSCHSARSVLTIAFQFPFYSSLQDNVAVMACQYICS